MSEKENSSCDTAEDIQLTRLAAKAAGYDISHAWNHNRANSDKPAAGLVTYIGEQLQSTYWDPLRDDGNAFRLAVKLQFDVIPKWGENCVCIIGGGDHFEEPQQPDIYAAMRRAIVRAAAAIGEKL